MSEEDDLGNIYPYIDQVDDYSPVKFYSKHVGKNSIRGNLQDFSGVQPDENETIIYTIDLGLQIFAKKHPTIHTHTIPKIPILKRL